MKVSIATFAGCLLVSTLSGTGTASPEGDRTLLAYSVSPGDTYTYSSVSGAGKATIAIAVTSLDSSGFLGTSSLSVGRYKTPRVLPFNVQNGVRTKPGYSHRLHNFLTYDPATFCAAPASLIVGAAWSCHVEDVGYFDAGNVTVRVLSIDGSKVSLAINGVADVANTTAGDRENGQKVVVSTSGSWRTRVVYDTGIESSEHTKQTVNIGSMVCL
jgi:hypothetical protein